MADITMCTNYSCPVRSTCYRYMAEPNPFRQSIATFVWEGKCDYIIPLWSEADTTEADKRNMQ